MNAAKSGSKTASTDYLDYAAAIGDDPKENPPAPARLDLGNPTAIAASFFDAYWVWLDWLLGHWQDGTPGERPTADGGVEWSNDVLLAEMMRSVQTG